MSKRVLKERCQQLKKLEVAIEKVNNQILDIDCPDGELDTYFAALQELAEINRHLSKQRYVCREAIILHAVEVYGGQTTNQ
ncbi:hypothetical protein VPH184E372_0256 [Vibrio phage 184E37-2]